MNSVAAPGISQLWNTALPPLRSYNFSLRSSCCLKLFLPTPLFRPWKFLPAATLAKLQLHSLKKLSCNYLDFLTLLSRSRPPHIFSIFFLFQRTDFKNSAAEFTASAFESFSVFSPLFSICGKGRTMNYFPDPSSSIKNTSSIESLVSCLNDRFEAPKDTPNLWSISISNQCTGSANTFTSF